MHALEIRLHEDNMAMLLEVLLAVHGRFTQSVAEH
jgi:hypothetical protein